MLLLNGYWRSETMENFVDEWITSPLHNAMYDGEYLNMNVMKNVLDHCKNEDGMEVFHEKMKPYYRMYFKVNSVMFQNGSCSDVRRFILMAMEEDESFISWFTDNFCLWNVVHAWAEYYKKEKSESKEFMDLLLCFLSIGYECEWESHVNELRHILLREEIEGNQYSRAVYCMFHGFVMIGKTTLPRQEMIALYSQFSSHWFVLRFLYSAMFRCIIGCGFTNFVQIPNQMKSCVDYHPYLHLFYATAMEQKEVICNRGAKRDKLEASLKEIRVIASKEPSDELNVLCGILFPKVWKDYIEKNRLKNYKELEEELASMQGKVRELIDKQVKMLSDSAIPVEVIASELDKLSMSVPGMAYEVFEKLNSLLIANEAWTKNAPKIRNRILKKMQKPTVQATNYYESGANHNDHQKHLHISNDKKQLE